MTRFRRILVLVALVLALPWAMSVRAEYVQVTSELTIHYETSGHGDIAIVFIPGWTMTTEAFVHQLNHFEGSDRFRAIAYDPRGQGYSSKTVEGHTYPQHGRDLAALLEALELKKVILAGWSYGVTEQLAYLNQFGTNKIVGMIMIDTGPDVAGASYDEWVWYLDDDSNGYSRWFTEGTMEDRQTVITEFAKWMLEDPSPDNVAWVADMSNLTSGTVASVLNATGFYLDYSARSGGARGRHAAALCRARGLASACRSVDQGQHAQCAGGLSRQAPHVLGAPRRVQRNSRHVPRPVLARIRT